MDFRAKAISFILRALRLVGVLTLIYVCMVFYLALTERQNAYPRAIAHKEARVAIEKTAKSISCTLSDGIVLEGWILGTPENGLALYYPDADEDAAQFLAELSSADQAAFATFNHRGGGTNKGTPSRDTFEPDAVEIFQCAAQINGRSPQTIIGRGTGAILAAKQFNGRQKLVLIDPVFSIAEAVSEKYRAFYPSFMVRAKEKISPEPLKKDIQQVTILADRAKFAHRIQQAQKILQGATVIERKDSSLGSILTEVFK